MKISYNWLKQYINTDLSAEKVSEILTDTGLEVEGLNKVETIKGGLNGVLVGEVLTKEKHPDADRLNITTVNVGQDEPLQIVCGAPNVEAGQKVLVATVGTTLYPTPEESFKIKKSKIRGVESVGMICAEDELGLGESHDGIMVLEANTEVGLEAKNHFKIEDDYLIEIGLTPNRADAMGHIGVARDLKAFLNYHENSGQSIIYPEIAEANVTGNNIKLSISNPEACPLYSGAIIEGITIKESPDWLQNRLKVIGLSPINNVVDITNFVMHETGNPLHAFDLNKVDGEINVRNANKGEKILTLDEVERELDTNDLVICNAKDPMCIAGVFGGIDSGVSNDTQSIFLESAYFNPVSVRKTAKRHGLNTDSSFRFERGIDPNQIEFALKRAIFLIEEIAGGKLVSIQSENPIKVEGFEVDFNCDNCRRLSGADITNSDMVKILAELDINVLNENGNDLKLQVPAYRVDVQREADIIEEVLRIYGFNNVPLPEKLNASLSFQEKPNKEKIYNKTSNFLVDNGFAEIMNNSLTSADYLDKIESKSFDSSHNVSILNPLSNELDIMRQTMLFGGLKSIEHNQNRQHPNLRFFEFGKEYKKPEDKYIETKKLAIWLTGAKENDNWNSTNDKSDFYWLKGFVEGVFKKNGLWKNPKIGKLENDLFEDGYSINLANKNIADIGWIRKDILKYFGIKEQVFYAEINWDLFVELYVMNKVQFKPIAKTQFARRDFSLLINDSVKFQEIKEIANKIDRKILREVGLFDVYKGKNLEKGKKSYAVSFIFQDDEKTLKDKQIDAIMERIRKDLESKLGAELR